MMKSKLVLLFALLFYVALTFFSSSIPFFWDNTIYSELSSHYYFNGFKTIIAPSSLDLRGFYFYQLYMSLAWKLFGRTLLVSHLVILPFIIGIVFEFYKVAKYFLSDKMIPVAIILLLLEPTFNTQSLLMGYDIIPLYFFMVSINLLLQQKFKLLHFSLLLLALSNFRGLFLVAAIFIFQQLQFYKEHKFFQIKLFIYYLPATIAIIIWSLFHKINTGWYFFSPMYENNDEKTNSLMMMIKQLGFISWKLIDFGRIILWLITIIGWYILSRRLRITVKFKLLLYLLLIPLMVTSIFMAAISNPIGHRYFMFTYLILIIAACYIIEQLKSKKSFIAVITIVSVTLCTGNIWLYPERFGNGWDSSLKVLPYFKMKNEMDRFIVENKIAPSDIGTQFPLIADKQFSYLTDSSFHYTNVWRGPLNTYKYYLQTNVINTDIPEQVEDVKRNWTVIKDLKQGLVYLILYKNPKY